MTEDRSTERFSPPSVSIVIELEGYPRLIWNASKEGQFERLQDWLSSEERLADLVGRALILSPDFLSRLDEVAGE